ncbi:MAG: ABC transporter ATP-binding protein, partial [Synergistota bacterium]|nr:ABC transporter ATP-binding protein [Synergistota bacterium]
APWLLKNIVDDVLISKNSTVLNLLAVGLVVLYLFKNVAYYGQQYLMNWVGQRVVLDIRLRLYDHMQRMSLKYLYGQRVGELLSRITNDVMILQDMITGVLIDVVVQSLSFIGMVGFLLYINWRLTLITFAVLPLAGFVIDRTSKRLRKVGHEIQRQLAGLSAIANEALSAIRIVRSFATEEQEYKRFQSQSGAHFSALMRGVQTNAALMGAVEIILIVALSIILWFGGRIVIRGGMTPGDLVAFLGYLALLVQPVRVFSRVVARMQQGLAAGDRIFEILDTKNEVVTPEDPVFLKPVRGDIAFTKVSFSYIEGNPVLSDIDLNIRPGEKVAIVGPTGAGKTTLADLVTRLYDPDRGEVSIDGVNVKDLDLPTLRKQTGIVPQDPILLKGSVAFNISYGCESATEESIREAARIAGIHTFIESLAEGYETEVGERGVTLSGGQRQRMAIARAVVRDPRIIILDEATSSLDAAVEQEVQEAMRKAMRGRTSIVIAHRLATVREADRIIVLENGRIAEEGAHEQLKSAGGLYSRLCELQFGNGNGASS